MKEAISGAILLGCWVVGLLFFRFHRRHREKLFWYFGAAFWLLAIERLLLLVIRETHEFQFYVYVVRLVAFLLIFNAIYQKNRSGSAP
jgi:uncharacterized membrane protein